MPKLNPLQNALSKKNESKRIVQVSQREETVIKDNERPPSRVGKVLIGGHFSQEIQTELKIIAAIEHTTIQSLLAEGINLVLARRGRPEIANLTINHKD